jgi:thymidylate kinase
MPKLVCVTGPDGSGKTTQIARIAERLERRAKK